MELQQMKYFEAIALGESMTKCAKTLHVSQSALSLSMKNLEKELGAKLFERNGRNLQLTADGRFFLTRVTNILSDIDSAVQELHKRILHEKDTISLMGDVTDIVMETQLLYSKLNPEVIFKQVGNTSISKEKLLLSQQVDLCFSYSPLAHSRITDVLLIKEPMLLLINNKHKLAQKSTIRLEELQDEVVISMGEGTGFRNMIDQFFRLASTFPKRIREVDNVITLFFMVHHDTGVSFIPESIHNRNLRDNLSLHYKCNAIPVVETFCNREVYVSYIRDKVFSPVLKDYYATLIKIGELIKEIKKLPDESDFLQ